MTLEKSFQVWKKNIAGEESNTFTNELGEKIVVQICQTEEETAKLLQTVLDNNEAAAKALARAAHQDVELSVPTVDNVILNIPHSKIGMWVDPIDSTYQYIKGSADIKACNGIYSKGLQCVTILIGVFLTDTGLPIMGVINQPFATRDKDTLRWKSHLYWGLSYMDINICSLDVSASGGIKDKTNCSSENGGAAKNSYSAVTSSAETKDILSSLSTVCGDNLHFAAGAGYKCLCVILGLVDFYVFSEDTTFKWDCCAPHAILKSLGGGILDLSKYMESIRKRKIFSERPHLVYNVPVDGAVGADMWANVGGLVAYRSDKHLEHFMDLFFKKLPLQSELH
ncbi:inositol polyphosphate-1-phosphatase L homeolog [Xenopus laevis]|uniref:inositol-1,4-bisphosphate 1-phosphatase n=1 Tax=Xenopus laevis TaxID=8355 RepID=Q6PB10_XENLA|nr:inositol polyphosphate-1-phosphatase L homeolog [Xenopus laevis]AAH59974.1 MGC68618 protein [Xenopus laevis]